MMPLRYCKCDNKKKEREKWEKICKDDNRAYDEAGRLDTADDGEVVVSGCGNFNTNWADFLFRVRLSSFPVRIDSAPSRVELQNL